MSIRPIALTSAAVAVLACLFALSAPAADRSEHKRLEDGRWVELGSREVDFKSEHDTVEVGKAEGRFTALRIDVADGDLVMEKMRVTFGDGSTFEPKTRAEFKPGQTSQTIDLPNKSHVIKRVDFSYHSRGKHEKATVMLFGKES
jgi:hypothetical protein